MCRSSHSVRTPSSPNRFLNIKGPESIPLGFQAAIWTSRHWKKEKQHKVFISNRKRKKCWLSLCFFTHWPVQFVTRQSGEHLRIMSSKPQNKRPILTITARPQLLSAGARIWLPKQHATCPLFKALAPIAISDPSQPRSVLQLKAILCHADCLRGLAPNIVAHEDTPDIPEEVPPFKGALRAKEAAAAGYRMAWPSVARWQQLLETSGQKVSQSEAGARSGPKELVPSWLAAWQHIRYYFG